MILKLKPIAFFLIVVNFSVAQATIYDSNFEEKSKSYLNDIDKRYFLSKQELKLNSTNLNRHPHSFLTINKSEASVDQTKAIASKTKSLLNDHQSSLNQKDTIDAQAQPNVIVAKRITAINRGRENEQLFDQTYVDDADTMDNDPLWPKPIDASSSISTFIAGAALEQEFESGDTVEYTIYFLSNGSAPATNVRICDLVPPNTTYVSESLTASIDQTEIQFTDEIDNDQGEYLTKEQAFSANCLDPSESNGAIVVRIVTAPAQLIHATSNNTPKNSYGYVRFQVKAN